MSSISNTWPKWKLVPTEPTPEIIAGAALACLPTASARDLALARQAAPIVLMKMDAATGFTVDMLAATIATMAPAYRAMLAAAPAPAAAHSLSQASCDVLAERRRQVELKGWDHEHDDAHPCGEIAAFAAVYAMPEGARDWPATDTSYGDTFAEALTPIEWKPKFGDRRRDLVKAAALLIAEIERIDRAASTKKAGGAA